MVVQGRKINPADIHFIQELMTSHPLWHHTQISRELCKLWNWRKANDQLKDMACRTLLLKLERTGYITLPMRRREHVNHSRGTLDISVGYSDEAICCNLNSLTKIKIILINPGSDHHLLFNCLLSRYHYLGHKTTVGENMKYLITDCLDRPLSCVLFGSAAWKTLPRDTFIGWNHGMREKNVNNKRTNKKNKE